MRAQDDVQVAEQGFAITVAGGPTGPVVDQSQPLIDTSVGGLAIGSSSEQKLAQIVLGGITGSLDEVRFPVACSDGTLVVQIQGVDGTGEPDGVVRASESVPASSLPSFGSNPPTLRPISFSSPAVFNTNDSFAIVLDNPTGSCGVFQGPLGTLIRMVARSSTRGRINQGGCR